MEYYESPRDKIIFLDFDGVLTCESDYFENGILDNLNCIHNLKEYLPIEQYILLTDTAVPNYNKIKLVKKICDETGAKIVVTSSYIQHFTYPKLAKYLINLGLPIVGEIHDSHYRGTEIRSYIKDCNIKNYIILDDEIFEDFNRNLREHYDNGDKYQDYYQEYYGVEDYSILDHLILTDFYDEGLNEELADDAIKLLRLQNNK